MIASFIHYLLLLLNSHSIQFNCKLIQPRFYYDDSIFILHFIVESRATNVASPQMFPKTDNVMH